MLACGARLYQAGQWIRMVSIFSRWRWAILGIAHRLQLRSSDLSTEVFDNEPEYPGGLLVLEKDERTLLGLTKMAGEAGDWAGADLAAQLAEMAAWLRHDAAETVIAGRLHWQLTLYRGGDEGFDLAEFANAWKDAAELVG